MKNRTENLRTKCARSQSDCDKKYVALNVLIACEESQAECRAFRELGHNAFSCDIQPCRPGGNPDWHIQGDVTPFLSGKCEFTTQSGQQYVVGGWDLIIAHPPCTYLCKLSSVWMKKDPDTWAFTIKGWENVNGERYNRMLMARQFFINCLNAKSHYVAVENPLPMKIAELPKPTCYADPSWFGVKYTKKTLYWLKNLPPVMASATYRNPKSYVNSSRGKYRSRTFPQLAKAIAIQWSKAIIDDYDELYDPGNFIVRKNNKTIKYTKL